MKMRTGEFCVLTVKSLSSTFEKNQTEERLVLFLGRMTLNEHCQNRREILNQQFSVIKLVIKIITAIAKAK